MKVIKKQNLYLLTAILSFSFALIGFSYNVWRLEVTEANNTIRMASFQVLLELAELEQVAFAAHYDKDLVLGNPRTGWVKVGLINDLSPLVSEEMVESTAKLRTVWRQEWELLPEQESSVEKITQSIDLIRADIKKQLAKLN